MFTRIRLLLLLPIDCTWNAWVRHYTAEGERLVYNLRGGHKGFLKRLCRDHGVCLPEDPLT